MESLPKIQSQPLSDIGFVVPKLLEHVLEQIEMLMSGDMGIYNYTDVVEQLTSIIQAMHSQIGRTWLSLANEHVLVLCIEVSFLLLFEAPHYRRRAFRVPSTSSPVVFSRRTSLSGHLIICKTISAILR